MAQSPQLFSLAGSAMARRAHELDRPHAARLQLDALGLLLARGPDAAGLAERCTIQLSYAIGVARPLSIYVNTHDTGEVDDAVLEKAVARVMDLTPRGIRKHLDLNKPIYARTAAYGHFGRKAGRDGSFSWEKTDLVKAIKAAVKDV